MKILHKEELKEPRVKLGCPHYCKGWVCVDFKPLDDRVLNYDVYEYLKRQDGNIAFIKAKNLIEHLQNIGDFFRLCYRALKIGGQLEIITDNAEWFPFYWPLVYHLGIGAHASNEYKDSMNGSRHYCIFTKLHLKNLLEYYGFKIVKVNRMVRYGYARLYARAVKSPIAPKGEGGSGQNYPPYKRPRELELSSAPRKSEIESDHVRK